MSQPSTAFHVFLSYNRKDEQTVERIAEELKRANFEPWFDKWCLTPAGAWQDQLAMGLRSCSAYAFFVGPSGFGDWARLELNLAIDRMAKDRDFRVFLVLLPDLPEPFDISKLPPFLTTRTWVDMRKGILADGTFQQFLNAIQGLAPGPAVPIEPRVDVCPYRGLQAFSEEDKEFFFGRDAEIQRLVERLKVDRLLAVIGPSGSGKSSLVLAGLIPALRAGAVTGSHEWTIQVFTPGALPLTSLVANLKRINPQMDVAGVLKKCSVEQQTFHLEGAVAFADQPSASRLVWVIDQFEEIFTLCKNESERQAFISNLLYAALIPGGRDIVVLTMRADFYQKCAAYPELAAQITNHQFLVSPMTIEGLRDVIEKPAWRVGLKFEQGLVATIMDDVESQSGALPLLEHALLELWQRRHGDTLSLASYRETDGVTGAIAKRADVIYRSFNQAQKDAVRRVMLRLTQPGEGTEDTRRRALKAELTGIQSANEVEQVVQAMADARLLTIASADALTPNNGDENDQKNDNEIIVDVAHEALIRGWPRLRRWVEEDRAGLRTHRRITEAAEEWKRTKDESLLFRGARLSQSLEFRESKTSELTVVEKEFLSESQALRDRDFLAARRRARNWIIALALFSIVIAFAAGYAFLQKSDAFARALAANAITQLNADPELALILAIEATKIANSPETEDALRQALIRAPVHVFTRVNEGSGENFFFGSGGKFSPDGKKVLFANGKKLQLYDRETGQSIREFLSENMISEIAYSQNGKLVGALTKENLNVWEVETGRNVLKHGTAYSKMIFTPDNDSILLSDSIESYVVEINSGRKTPLMEGSFSSFSRDGQIAMMTVLIDNRSAPEELKIAPYKTEVLFYETKGWKLLNRIATTVSSEIHTVTTPLAALSPDGNSAFIGSDLKVGIYDFRNRTAKTVSIGPTPKGDYFNEATNPVFSPNGKFVAFVANEAPKPLPAGELLEGKLTQFEPNRTLQIWDTETEEPIIFNASVGLVTELEFSPDGRFLIAVDDKAHLYDLESRRHLTEFGAVYGISTIEFSADGRYIVADAFNSVYVWDLMPWRSIIDIKTHSDSTASENESVLTVDFSPAESYITTTQRLSNGGLVTRFWDPYNARLSNEKLFATIEFRDGSVAVSPDGKWVVLTIAEKAEIWNLVTGQIQSALDPKQVTSHKLSFNYDSRLFATAADGKIQLWKADDGQELVSIEGIDAQELQLNGRLVFVIERKSVVGEDYVPREEMKVIDLVSKHILWHIDIDPDFPVGSMYFARDKLIVAYGPQLQVRNATTGIVISNLQGHVDQITSATLSPNGDFVVTTTAAREDEEVKERVRENENEIRVWNANTGTMLYEFRDHGTPLKFGRFSADGRFVLAVGRDDRVRVYACDVCGSQAELLKLAQARRMRELTSDEKSRYLN